MISVLIPITFSFDDVLVSVVWRKLMLVNCKRAYDGVFVTTNRLWSLDLRESSVEQVTNT